MGCVFWESVITRVYIVEMSKDNRENTANPGNERIQNFSKEIMYTREGDMSQELLYLKRVFVFVFFFTTYGDENA